MSDTKKPVFNADAAEEYFSDLLVFYRNTANDIFRKDNEGRHASNQTYSAEYQKYVGMQVAMREVLEYFSKFDLCEWIAEIPCDRLRELVEADKSERCVILGAKPDLRPGVDVSRCFIVDDDGEIIEDNVCSAEVGPDSSGKMNVIYNTFDSGDFEAREVGHRIFWDENTAKKGSEGGDKTDEGFCDGFYPKGGEDGG